MSCSAGVLAAGMAVTPQQQHRRVVVVVLERGLGSDAPVSGRSNCQRHTLLLTADQPPSLITTDPLLNSIMPLVSPAALLTDTFEPQRDTF